MKKSRKIAAAVVAAAMCLSSIGFSYMADYSIADHSITASAATTIWDGSIDTSWYDGEETEMHISTAEEFAGFVKLIAGGTNMANQTIILDKDIYLNDIGKMDPESTDEPVNIWDISGGTFNGTFDGKKHTIYGMFTKTAGLFNTVGEDATVQNVNIDNSIAKINIFENTFGMICSINSGSITDCNVNATIIQKESGEATSFGMITGLNQGMIENCTTNGIISVSIAIRGFGGICAVSIGNINKCTNNAIFNVDNNQDSSNYGVGGIVGRAAGNVTDCVNNAELGIKMCSVDGLGGIIGVAADINISNCINNGSILFTTESDRNNYIGGILGSAYRFSVQDIPKLSGGCYKSSTSKYDVIMNECINNGEIQVKDIRHNNCSGGIIGYDGIDAYYEHTLAISQCGNNGDINGISSGGILGVAFNGRDFIVDNVYNKGNITGEYYAGGLFGRIIDSTQYNRTRIINNSYNTGNINGATIGGLQGYKSSSVLYTNCYSAAQELVTVDDENYSSKAGALIGVAFSAAADDFQSCYYLNSGAPQAIGDVTGEFGTPKSAANMKKEAFAASLGNAFVYNPNGFPMLFWEAGVPMLSIDKTALSFNEYMQQETITPDTSYEGELKWTSSDDKIATVDKNGVVTAIGNGICVITVEADGAKASCEVTVAYEYYLKETAITMKPDLAKELKVYSKSNDEPTTLEVKYSSSNEDVAEVNKRGVVSANAPGVAEIHAEIGSMDLVCVVTVEGVKGDVNVDGEFNVSDVVLLQKWLLAVPDTHLANWKAADLCEDNRLDVFDLCLMKRELVDKKA